MNLSASHQSKSSVTDPHRWFGKRVLYYNPVLYPGWGQAQEDQNLAPQSRMHISGKVYEILSILGIFTKTFNKCFTLVFLPHFFHTLIRISGLIFENLGKN